MIVVLMSTYNGEKYLREQLDSVLSQEIDDLCLIIRDDGSRDGTLKILKEYEEKNSNVKVYFEQNVGVVCSFFRLLDLVPNDVEYIATCDQDDVWMKDKIKVAIEKIRQYEQQPTLYCSRTQLVDEKLNKIENRMRTLSISPSWGNALIENICTGCTMVANRLLWQMVRGTYSPYCLMHDWWFYLAASAFGKVVYDQQPHILYRQHKANVVGKDENRWGLIKRQIKSFQHFKGTFTAQLRSFDEMFPLEDEQRELLKMVIGTHSSWNARRRVLFEKKIYRQGRWDNIIFRIMLGIGVL